MERMIVKVLVFLAISFTFISAETITFKELTKLASADLGKNIHLDKDIKNYTVEFNIVDHQKSGEVFQFFRNVLFAHDMYLQFNKDLKYYTVEYNKEKNRKVLDPSPVPASVDRINYYTYKIKNTTNVDVVKAMSIFRDVSYQHLEQSDLIAYASTRSVHDQIQSVLHSADNAVNQKTIKITLFSINKSKFLSYGSSINTFQYDFDSTLDGVFQAFRSGGASQFSLNDTASIGFTLHALKGHSIADIFQEPTLLITNGVKTGVNSVSTVPYLRTTATVDSTTNSVTEQYDYKDIGLQIEVLPKIKGDWVYLNLDLISEELISLDDDKPITQKITYKSSVKILKGKPVLLTGIQKTSTQIEKDGVPLLSDLPLIGELFKQKAEHKEDLNVNILIEVL